jgi:3',5'-cyclic AMP phosphodiesterase CpdA
MREHTFLRILHISDLHFTGAPFEPRIDSRRASSAMKKSAGEAPDVAFRKMLVDYLKKYPEDQWPAAIVVSGDLVDKGGTDGDEFGNARRFLADLAADLGIRNRKRVFIVPGNHDVTWDPRLPKREKFERFSQAMKEFTRPIMDGDEPAPVTETLTGIRGGVAVQLTLLISPTFSGIEQPLPELGQKVQLMLEQEAAAAGNGSAAMSEAQVKTILNAIKDAQSLLDIALIGAHQLTVLREKSSDDAVRIAVMHHHLLPDPQIDLAQFESVLDAGRTLDTLLQLQFDLVLHGHKHNAHLASYRRENRSINVYAGSSLFVEPSCGFAFVDVYPADTPAPIRVTQFDVNYRSRSITPGYSELLEREGHVVPAVLQRLAEIPAKRQTEVIQPVVEMVSALEEWSREYDNEDLFESVRTDFLATVESLRRRRIVLRRNVADQWRALIERADGVPRPEILLVSNDDLDYWIRSVQEGTPAYEYRQPLVKFNGKKSRILIVKKETLKTRAKELEQIINDMISEKMTVILTRRKQLPRRLHEEDFGVVSRFAVSRFDDREGVIRGLNVSFAQEDVDEMLKTWEMIYNAHEWKAAPGGSPDAFRKWLKRTYDIQV